MLKRIISILMILIIVPNIFVFHASASVAPALPPITVSSGSGGPVLSLLQQILLGLGVTSDLSSKGLSEAAMEYQIDYYKEHGEFPDGFYIDGEQVDFDVWAGYYFNTESQKFKDAMYQMGWNLYDFVNRNESSIIETLVNDLKGYGAMMYVVSQGRNYTYYSKYYCDYILASPGDSYITYYTRDGYYREYWNSSNSTVNTFTSSNNFGEHNRNESGSTTTVYVYGDVRFPDGTQAETNDETEPVIGETPDGTKVTADMLDPDGTVDGQPVNVDWSKFDMSAIIDLLEQILEASKNNYIVDENPNLQLDTAEKLPDIDMGEFDKLKNKKTISTVFPFCLPWDFVRGMKLFVATPEVPHFEAEIVVPEFLGVPEQRWKFVIDLKDFEPVAKITRWLSLISFSFLLIFLSTKIVKGGGA